MSTATQTSVIEAMCLQGMSTSAAYLTLRPLVLEQKPPMIFKRNVPGGKREPKPIDDQLYELKTQISRIYKRLGRNDPAFNRTAHTAVTDPAVTEPTTANEPTVLDPVVEESIEEPETVETIEEIKDPTVAAGKVKIRTAIHDELSFFLAEIRRIREWCLEREARKDYVDSISMRPVVAAAKLIPDGVPARALLHAMSLAWDSDARDNAEIQAYDQASFVPIFSERDREIWENRKRENPLSRGEHKLMPYVEALAKQRQPIFLVGPPGTGKSHMARQLSDKWNIAYGETPITPGATRGDMLGRWVGSDKYVSAEFCRMYTGGGIFNFEELDAGDAGMLLVLNNALAGTALFNSTTGETLQKSPDFVPMATGNTHGTGATIAHGARERLDTATLDRWRIGKVMVPHDDNLESDILFGRI